MLFWHLFSETVYESLTQMHITSLLKQLFPSLAPQANENIAKYATKGCTSVREHNLPFKKIEY